MELRRFNTAGLTVFQAFLDSHNSESPLPWPESALSDPGYSEVVDGGVELEHRAFETRFDLAKYLHTCFDAAGLRVPRADAGLWSWIACFYFREICPTSKAGVAKPGATPRWIPRSADYRRYYRHLIASPFSIYLAHSDHPLRAMALLCQRPGRPGDLVEQLASRQQIVTNSAVMQIATDWFIDATTGKQNTFANSKGRGGPRRLVDVLAQFEVTWDLSMMSPEELRRLLPREFKSKETAT